MPVSRISFLALAGLVAVAACSESTRVTQPQPAAQPQTGPQFDATPANPRNIMETRDAVNSAANKASRTSTGIFYHGGPVLQAGTNVVAVYWAGGSSPIYTGGPTPGSAGSGSQDGSLVGFFLRNLGGSKYFNINTTYTDGSGKAIANVVNYTGYWANNTNAPSGTTSVSDAAMVAMLQSGFDSGALKYDASTLYLVFTAGQVNLGGGFGTQYCAYHTHGTVTINGASRTALYAAMPYDYAYPSACTNSTASPNGDPGADAEVNTLAHEIEETTTDMMGNAWYDRRGYENADKCAWNFGTTTTLSNGGVANIQVGGTWFLVQQNWLNAGNGGCYQGLN